MALNQFIDRLKKKRDDVVSSLDRDKSMSGFQVVPGGFNAGIDRVKQSFKTDPGQYGLSRLFAGQVSNTQQLFTPLIGREKADKLAYGIRGASQITPFNLTTNQKTRNIYKASEPTTETQKQAQSLGRSIYGLGLTAPIGAGSMAQVPIKQVAKKLFFNTAKRAVTGSAAGGALGAGIAKVTGTDVKQGFKQGAIQGFKNSPYLAVTNPISEKIIKGVAPASSFVTKQFASRTMAGGLNVVEDELLSKIDGLKNTNPERALSFALAFTTTSNSDLLPKPLKDKIQRFFSNKSQSRLKPKENQIQAQQLVTEVQEHVSKSGRKYLRSGNKFAGSVSNKVDEILPNLPGTSKIRQIGDKFEITTKPGISGRARTETFTSDVILKALKNDTDLTTVTPQKRNQINYARFMMGVDRPGMSNMAGFGLGIEPEYDEEGKFKGVKYDPAKGMLGVAGLIGGKNALKYADQTKFSSLLDEKPRFEIDDSGAKLKINTWDDLMSKSSQYGGKAKVSDVIDHPQLFKQYPELKDYSFKFTTKDGLGGSFDGNNKTISVAYDLRVRKPEEIKSTLLHEIQHAIQDIEGFARGGSPKEFMGDLDPKIAQLTHNMMERELKDFIDNNGGLQNIRSNEGLLKKFNELQNREAQAFELRTNPELYARERYRRLSGELESRAVQRRADLPENKRTSIDPYAEEAKTTTGRTDKNDFSTRFLSGEQNSVDNNGNFKGPYKRGDQANIQKRIDAIIGSTGASGWKQDFAVKQKLIDSMINDESGYIPKDVKNELSNLVDQLDYAKESKLNPSMSDLADITSRNIRQNVEVKSDITPNRQINNLVESYSFGENQVKKLEDIQSKVDAQENPREFQKLSGEIQKIETGNRSVVKQLSKELGVSEHEAVIALSEYIDIGARRGKPTLADFYNFFRKDTEYGKSTSVAEPKMKSAPNGKIPLTPQGKIKLKQPTKVDANSPGFQSLNQFLNDPNRMLRMGYTKTQVDKINAKEARKIVEGNIQPFEYYRNVAIDTTGKDPNYKQPRQQMVDDPNFIDSDEAKRIIGQSYFEEMEGQDEFIQSLKKWIGKREVANTTGTQKAMRFASIPKENTWEIIKGLEGKSDSNNPEVIKAVGEFRKEYDSLITDARKSGVDVGYLENYVTHIWQESPEEVQKQFMSARGRFKYKKDRVIPTYEEGIKIGLKPKYTNPAQILEAYVSNLEKAKANVEFIESLKNRGLLVPASVAKNNPDFKPVQAPGIGENVTMLEDGQNYVGSWYAPSKVADTINKVFAEPSDDAFSKGLNLTARVSSKVQDITLSGGLPATPLNAFTVANIQKEILAGRVISPLKAFVRSVSPKASQEFFAENVETIKKLQSNNIPIRTSFNIDDMIDKPLKQKLGWGNLMNDPTFKRFLPQLQIQFFNDIEQQALKSGKNAVQAEEIAVKALKNFYGTISTDSKLLRSRNGQDLTTTLFFAPTFRESMINFWVNNAKAISPIHAEFNRSGAKKVIPSKLKLNNPLSLENRNNTKFLIGATITYASMDALNQAINGHPMSENPKGKEDKLLIPLGDGNTLGIPFLSSIGTVPRGIYRQGKALVQGDPNTAIKDAFSTYSSSLVKPPIEALAINQDYFGNQVYDPDDSTKEKIAAQSAHIVKSYNHPFIRESLDIATESLPISDDAKKSLGIKTEKKPLYQSISQSMELPFRFYKTESIENAPFWDSYFKNKPIADKYEELKYKDPQKALSYLQENRQTLEEFEKQKVYAKQYSNQEKDSSVLQSYLGTQKQGSNQVYASEGPVVTNDKNTREFIKDRIKLGDTVNNNELEVAYLGDINELPNNSKYEKAIRSSKVFGKISDIENSEYLSEDQKSILFDAVAKEAGISRDDLDYYQVARKDTNIKMGAVYDEIESFGDDREGMLNLLGAGRKEVNGAKLITDAVLDNLYDDGIISKAEKKYLESLKWDEKTQSVKKKAGGSGKKIKIKPPSVKAGYSGGGSAIQPVQPIDLGSYSHSSNSPRLRVKKLSSPKLKIRKV